MKIIPDEILTSFDNILGNIGTEYVKSENEDGICAIEVNTISDEDLNDLRKIFDQLEKINEWRIE